MYNITDIRHALYINLESRPDRNQHIIQELELIGIPAERFNAVKLKNGAAGCSMSHLKCLQMAKANKWDHVLIMEDDIKFTDPELFTKQLNTFFTTMPDWDVVLFAGNNVPPYYRPNDSCIKVTHCRTTTGYLVKSNYYDTLIDNIKEGLKLLIEHPLKRANYAIDMYWNPLQLRDKWYLITPLTVIQSEGYSDIEERVRNYSKVMLDVDKPWLRGTTGTPLPTHQAV